MPKLKEHYNAASLALKCKVHYKTVLYWFKKNKLAGAHRSPTSNEILIPIATAEKLMQERGIVVDAT